MLAIVDFLNQLMKNFEVAPSILFALGIAFFISFFFVLRELTSWFIKTTGVRSQFRSLHKEIERLETKIDQMHLLLLNDKTNETSVTVQTNSKPTEKSSNFPLTH